MVAGVTWPEMTAREEANTVIEEFVALVKIWSDMTDIQQKSVRMYIENCPLEKAIS